MELTKKLEDLLSRDENLRKQKSRETWLTEGDKNTKTSMLVLFIKEK